MNASTNVQLHLFMKEWRRTIPLVLILAILALKSHFIGVLNPQVLGIMSSQAFFGLPLLFALGCGALLVSQEKEQRTIHWLRAMPISRRQILGAKLMAGLATLALAWCISSAMFAVVASSENLPFGFYSDVDVFNPIRPLCTIFVLLTGLALAWKLQSTLLSLILVAPIALLPGLLTATAGSIFHFANLDWIQVVLNLLGIVVVGVYGWRVGMQFLGPASSLAISSPSVARSSPAISWLSMDRLTPHQSLLRQFSVQSRSILFLILAVLVVLPVMGIWIGFSLDNSFLVASPYHLPLYVVLGICLATSWLGVLAYQGDRIGQRVRFLSDRGIAPGRVWLTRHLIPWSILVLSALSAALAFGIVNPHGEVQVGFVWAKSIGVGVVFLAVLSALYVLSQWVGQLIPSPVISAIVAPVFSVLTIAYYVQACVHFNMPIWTVGLLWLVPLLATYLQMKGWMDGNIHWRFWFKHGGWLGVIALVPALSTLVWLASAERMPPEIRRGLESEWTRSLTSQPMQPTPLERGNLAYPDDFGIEDKLNVIMSQIEQGLQPDRILVVMLRDELTLQGILCEAQQNSEAKALYKRLFSIVLECSKSLRRSHEIADQTVADACDMMLVGQLQKSSAKEILDNQLYVISIQHVSDSNKRDDARRIALAVAWNNANRTRRNSSFGKFELPRNSGFVSMGAILTQRSYVDTLTTHLWELLAASNEKAIARLSEQVRLDWNANFVGTDINLVSPYDFVRQATLCPAAFWRGKWEEQAIELMQRIEGARP
jgi:hypothetical protein